MSKAEVTLFIPCYINDFYPKVALSTMRVLEDLGFSINYPFNQKCCGQPFLNNGLFDEAKEFANHFIDTFSDYDYIVAPSSSCIGAIKYRYSDILDDSTHDKIKNRVFEFCEFLYDIVGVDNLEFKGGYRGKVGLHNSCHAIRELNLASASELNIPHFSKIEAVLSKIEGLEVLRAKKDECCGFGGSFSIQESDISVAMGKNRINDHLSNGVNLIAGVDVSCLMHMEAIAKRERIDLKVAHISQLITGDI